MKPTKVAAVIAGSVMALGAAAPAMAADNLAPTSLTGGLDTLSSQLDAHPVQSGLTDGSVVNQVKQTASGLNSVNDSVPLLGGLPLAK
ncbi:hypothetical protein [Streptomyces beijiangensis]|uniref:Secreted protein n=1 Tax=Streptomyces beijiangensis TaxID=163361 RepID=A0A939JJ66_9ACTN|nr:hypothetical protein [Streptomyces beijiangensis]MBO0514427.1 hypothetical protein [Streptomyces beijiangensis]